MVYHGMNFEMKKMTIVKPLPKQENGLFLIQLYKEMLMLRLYNIDLASM